MKWQASTTTDEGTLRGRTHSQSNPRSIATLVLLVACSNPPSGHTHRAASSSGGNVDASVEQRPGTDASRGLTDSPTSDGTRAAGSREAGAGTGPGEAGARNGAVVDVDGGAATTIRIATFNLENFGPTKAGRAEDVAIYVAAIRRYDVVAVQEIQNKTGAAARALLAAVNNVDGPTYEMLLSDNAGREPDDQTSQERYAYFFNTQTVASLGPGELFDDSAHDSFQREPFLGRFRAGSMDFTLAQVHTRPQSALEEMGALDSVIAWARNAYGDQEVIALGDFNASCDYASTEELDRLALRGPGYQWIVPDDADTNVSARACAYDRIVATTAAGVRFTGAWGVDTATGTVSDHYPVWAEIR